MTYGGVDLLETRAARAEREGDMLAARDAYDAALALAPQSRTLAEGRARVALALHEPQAAAHCGRALAFHRDFPDRQVQMLLVAAAEIGEAAIPMFDELLFRYPTHVGAHEAVSELRAEWGWPGSFTHSYEAALSANPKDRSLLLSYWASLSRARRYEDVLESMNANRSLFGADRTFALMEANVASHFGLIDKTMRLLAGLDEAPDAQVIRGQAHLQAGNAKYAASVLEQVVLVQAENQTAWSLLELAWRGTNDLRHDWLIGQPGLIGVQKLALEQRELASIASTLKQLHARRCTPIGQSVRGGSQTAGQLFERRESEIETLIAALTDAIRAFVSNLPAYDARHPLLRYRHEGLAFGPSWSVRLSEGGFHAAHFHPNGVISSACYVSLPELTDGVEKQGWLELGRPPAELHLDAEPIATIKPETGSLVLFPSFLFHGTRPFSAGERLTVAFDLVPVTSN